MELQQFFENPHVHFPFEVKKGWTYWLQEDGGQMRWFDATGIPIEPKHDSTAELEWRDQQVDWKQTCSRFTFSGMSKPWTSLILEEGLTYLNLININPANRQTENSRSIRKRKRIGSFPLIVEYYFPITVRVWRSLSKGKE